MADLRHDFVNTINTPLDVLPPGLLAATFAARVAEGEGLIKAEPVTITDIRRRYSVDMQFAGQTHILRVDLVEPEIDTAALRALFEETYFNRFRVKLADIRANVVNANVSIIGVRPPVDLSTLIDPEGRKQTLAQAQTGTRQVRFDTGWQDTPIYWRDHLPLAFTLKGPAIIEQMDTTVLIEPDDVAIGDAQGNVIIQIDGAI